MECPHCTKNFHDEWSTTELDTKGRGTWTLQNTTCAACFNVIIKLTKKEHTGFLSTEEVLNTVIYPNIQTKYVSSEVPKEFSEDFKEAYAVHNISPKASAALSRRCLQSLLREKVKVNPSNLNKEIQQVLDSKQLPKKIADDIDAIRNIGNFATHPIKNERTGEIVDVEIGEAEWLLDLLDDLFDFYFIEPSESKHRREKLNKKLSEAGKSTMKDI
ncbi:MAG: DUF4145 domain-containing protein [Thaumarchaeota archaeon]|nr:DUF4145 domain-containing protein [Nitrososphaerota archaeon]